MDTPVEDLIVAARSAVPRWLVRCVVNTARHAGLAPGDDQLTNVAADAALMSRDAAPVVLAALERLLATDVDAQSTNPLSVLRQAVQYPTEVLVRHGVRVRPRDDFAVRAFPDDVYGLSPATWADVDESLAEPGLVWSAWKAMTVLRRRRAEGMVPPDPSGR